MQHNAIPTEPLPIAPLLAPLSESMMLHALRLQEGKHSRTPSAEQLDLKQTGSLSPWTKLYQRFAPLRSEALLLITQALKSGAYSTRWMITELSKRYPERSKPISHETISRWREVGLLPYEKDDYPDPDRAIAMLILRSLTIGRANAWTPKVPKEGSFWNEALWTCWRQDSPASQIMPCAIPLPSDLPQQALLWTGYLGADLKSPHWLRIGNLGCCRWAKIREYHGTIVWDITEQELELWGISTTNYSKELANDTPLTLHMLANLALLRLATERLETSQSALNIADAN
ncbi:MAG TPA: hypothetical protein VFV38_50080 [Ktedonobacteraceae bacterium]|nr:hypothetical protein [Ktedonobacteraceae bacterium]